MRLARFQRPELWGLQTFDQLSALRDEFLHRFFDSGTDTDNGSDVFNSWAPALDLYEDKENLVVTAELPGMKKEDIQISLHEDSLTVSGERVNEKKYEGAETSRSERHFGRFQRTITLPKQVDSNSVKAAYKDGILVVTLPKSPEAKPRQIEVSA